MPKNGMTGIFPCCWNTLFGFGEYDICFPVGVLAAIYMSDVKMAGQKNY
jgi:ABC-type phosphate transport system permease subunit